MGLLVKLVGLGGFLRGSKTLIGLITVGYTAIQAFAPGYVTLANEILQIAGVALLPIGLADKALRK